MNLHSFISISTSLSTNRNSFATLKNLCNRYATVKITKSKFLPHRRYTSFPIQRKLLQKKNLYQFWEL